jgi:CBS domain containing-hemolysin-like protein
VRQSQEEADESNHPIPATDLTIVGRAFDLSDRTVRQIMVPRTHIFWVNVNEFDQVVLERIMAENIPES